MKKIALLTVISALALSTLPALQAADASTLLQQALFEEEANHNLEEAIKGYQAVIQQTEEQRKLAATAVFRLGECYRKLGRTNESAAQYQRILTEYSDQATLATLSRQNLVGLGLQPKSSSTNQPVESLSVNEEEKDIVRIKAILKDSPDLINGPEQSYDSRLHYAVGRGKFKLAEFLLANGADVNFAGNSGWTPLHAAVQIGNKAMTEFLLDHGANVDARTSGQGQTPLHLAAENGLKTVAEVLLDHKADVNTITGQVGLSDDKIQATPLHLAVVNGRTALAELLLKKGAKVQARDKFGRQPLHRAAELGQTTLAELLINNKADVNATEYQGQTPLHLAARRGHTEIIEKLITHNANLNAQDSSGQTPLFSAILYGSDPSTVALLLKHKADPNIMDKSGRSPLHAAIKYSGSNPSPRFTPMAMPGMAPPGYGGASAPAQGTTLREQICELLLSNGADIAAPDKSFNGFTPLHHAVDLKDEAVLKVLLAHKPNLNIKDRYDMTPMHRAASTTGGLPMVQMLVEAGADVNAVGYRNQTPLFEALQGNNDFPVRQQMVAFLLNHKANPNVLNTQGSTPLSFAKSLPINNTAVFETRQAIIDLLKNAGANEALDRLNRIEVTRRAEPITGPVPFERSTFTNNWNRFTLLELVAKTLVPGAITVSSKPSSPGLGGYGGYNPYSVPGTIPSSSPGRPVRPAIPPAFGPSSASSQLAQLAFPDLAHVKITRWDLKTGHANEISANVTNILASGDRSKDILLEWGDSVEIPEVDHKTSETWPGLSEDEVNPLYAMLKREVTIIVKGEKNRRTLIPFSLPDPAAQARSLEDKINYENKELAKLKLAYADEHPIVKEQQEKIEKLKQEYGKARESKADDMSSTISTFWLKNVITQSGLLRTSSDTSRIKVKRTEPDSGQDREYIINLEKVEGNSSDFWLRDADTIEIPER